MCGPRVTRISTLRSSRPVRSRVPVAPSRSTELPSQVAETRRRLGSSESSLAVPSSAAPTEMCTRVPVEEVFGMTVASTRVAGRSPWSSGRARTIRTRAPEGDDVPLVPVFRPGPRPSVLRTRCARRSATCAVLATCGVSSGGEGVHWRSSALRISRSPTLTIVLSRPFGSSSGCQESCVGGSARAKR